MQRLSPLPYWTFGVIAGAPPIHHDDGFAADHPGVVTMRKRGDITWAGVELGAVGHLDVQRALDVVLEMRCLAQLGAGQRLDMGRPTPARPQGQPADLAAADGQQVDRTEVEAAGLVRGVEALLLCLLTHGVLLLSLLAHGVLLLSIECVAVDLAGGNGRRWPLQRPCSRVQNGPAGGGPPPRVGSLACSPCRSAFSASSAWTGWSPPRWAVVRHGRCSDCWRWAVVGSSPAPRSSPHCGASGRRPVRPISCLLYTSPS